MLLDFEEVALLALLLDFVKEKAMASTRRSLSMMMLTVVVVVVMVMGGGGVRGVYGASDEMKQKVNGGTVSGVKNYSVRGSVALGAEEGRGRVKPENVRVVLSVDGGARREESFLRADGSFEIDNVEAGTHLLEVFAIGLQFPQFRVDVSARSGATLRVSLVENKRFILPEPLVLRPIFADIEYYEVRESPHAHSCTLYMMHFPLVLFTFRVRRQKTNVYLRPCMQNCV